MMRIRVTLIFTHSHKVARENKESGEWSEDREKEKNPSEEGS